MYLDIFNYVGIIYNTTCRVVPYDNRICEFILGCLDNFGIAFYNDKDVYFQNLDTHNPSVAKPFWILIDINCHCNYKVNSKFV